MQSVNIVSPKFSGVIKGVNHVTYVIYTLISGEGGIRTPGSSHFNGFQDRRNRPLCHLSKCLSPTLL